MRIERYQSPYLASQMYIVKENNKAIIIDPFCLDVTLLKKLTVEYLFLTHEHYDHISGVNFLKKYFNCKVYCEEKCALRIQNPRYNMSAYFDILAGIPEFQAYGNSMPCVEPYHCSADKVFFEDTSIYWQGHEIRLMKTPGHTAGSACYLIDNKYLFSGDTLFAELETETGFPTGSKKDFKNITLNKLRNISSDVIVLPGHFSSFRLGKNCNNYE